MTVAISVWANGKKATTLIIHKGKDLKPIENQNEVLSTFQNKAWVTQKIIIKWLDLMFPAFDTSLGRWHRLGFLQSTFL